MLCLCGAVRDAGRIWCAGRRSVRASADQRGTASLAVVAARGQAAQRAGSHRQVPAHPAPERNTQATGRARRVHVRARSRRVLAHAAAVRFGGGAHRRGSRAVGRGWCRAADFRGRAARRCASSRTSSWRSSRSTPGVWPATSISPAAWKTRRRTAGSSDSSRVPKPSPVCSRRPPSRGPTTWSSVVLTDARGDRTVIDLTGITYSSDPPGADVRALFALPRP